MRIEERATAIALRGILFGVASSGLDPERQKSASIYLLVTGCNVPGATAAAVVGCTKQNISKLLKRIEERRDDPAFDAVLTRLEAQLQMEV